MGNKTQTAQTNQTTTPVNQAALQQIYGQVSNAASTPYQAYTGELTAPVNAQQTAGINNVNSAANLAQPYYQQAGNLASSASNPLTAAQIQQYQNPYTQNVVNATQAQLNDLNGQQQNSIKGKAASEGALGGDRQAVAQSTLAGQQALNEAPTIANLYANSYNSGLQTAGQQFQQNPLTAASALAGVGSGAQTAALQGAGQQINAGTLQQQTQQASDTANYGQYQAAQGFPFQEAAYLEQYGLPAALGQGSTAAGTQTTEGPTNLAPYLGAGIAGAGLFAKDGGRIGFASGGVPSYISAPDYITGGNGYLPSASPSQGTLQTPSLSYLKPSSTSSTPTSGTGSFGSLGSTLQNDFGSASFGGGNVLSGDAWGGDANNPIDGLTAADYGKSAGGLVEAIHSIHKAIKRSRGGSVSISSPFQTFDDGGDVSFSDRFQPATDSPFGGLPPAQAEKLLTATNSDNAVINPDTPFTLNPSGPVQGNPANMPAGIPSNAPSVVANDTDMPQSNPMTAALPPQITSPDNTPDAQSPAMAYSGDQAPSGLPPTVASYVNKPEDGHAGVFGTNLSDKTRSALVAAGLGIMASRSPFLGAAIGEGGLQGLKNYSESTKAEQDAAEKQLTHQQEAQRIANQASQYARSQSETERYHKATEEKEFKPTYGVVRTEIDPNTGTDRKIYGWIDPNKKTTTESEGQSSPPQPLVKPGQFDYRTDAPHVQNGDTLPEPVAVAGKSVDSLKADSEYYLTSGILPKASTAGRSPIAGAQLAYQNAVKNYGNALALTRGMTPEEVAEARRSAPGINRFILGQPGNQTVALGTAMRHIDTLEKYIKAYAASDYPTMRNIEAYVNKQFGRTDATDINAVAHIVGPEINKAIVAAGPGGIGERAEFAKMGEMGTSQSLSALSGIKTLLGGQLEGKERQAKEVGVNHDRFVRLVGPDQYNLLHGGGSGSSSSTGGLKEGQTGTRADGTRVIVKNGKIVPLQ